MDASSVAALGTSLSNAELGSKISAAVARKSLDAAEQQGQAAIALLENAASIGAPEAGKGGTLDVVG